MSKILTQKDAWNSKAIEELETLKETQNEMENRSDMIHKINMIDESLCVYDRRLESVLNLGEKLVDRIINVKKRKVNSNISVNTLAKKADLTIESKEKIFYDEELKKWNGKGDTILRNVFINFEGKIEINSAQNGQKLLFNNIDMAETVVEKLKNLEFDNLHICPSLREAQVEEDVFIDEIDDDMVIVNEDHFIDNFNDQFNDLAIEEVEPILEIQHFTELEPTPFTYHKAWAGPEQWKLSTVRKKTKIKNEKRKKKVAFFELHNKQSILSDRRSTLFREEDIFERRKLSRNLKKDYSLRVEDLYTSCKVTTMNCFIEKKEKIEEREQTIVDNTINEMNDMSINKDNEINQKRVPDNCKDNHNMSMIVPLKHPKLQKRVDIKELHEKINEIIKQFKMNEKPEEKCITFKKIYNKLDCEVTWQYMVVAILELANTGLKIDQINGENVIQ